MAEQETEVEETEETQREEEQETTERETEIEGEFDPKRAKAKIEKANSEAAGLRKRLKELEPLAQKAKELEEASKSKEDKLSEQLTAAQQEGSEAKRELAKLRVATRKGLTEAQAKRLVGESEEELEADADELLESFKTAEEETQEVTRRPKERLRPGAVPPPGDSGDDDPAKLAKEVSRSW